MAKKAKIKGATLWERVSLSRGEVKDASHRRENLLILRGKVDKSPLMVYNYTYQEATQGTPGPLRRSTYHGWLQLGCRKVQQRCVG